MNIIQKRNLDHSYTDLLESIALEETALSHFINVEAEKLQAITKSFEKGQVDVDDVLRVQESVMKAMRLPIKKEMLLQFKLEDVLNQINTEEKKCDIWIDDCIISAQCENSAISNCHNENLCHFPSIEFIKETKLKIPKCKPDLKKIKKVLIDTEICHYKTIKTLEGWKTIVNGRVLEHIFYISDNCNHSVHEIEFEIPFCTFVKLPSYMFVIEAKALVEDSSIQIINPRKLLNYIVLFVCIIPQC